VVNIARSPRVLPRLGFGPRRFLIESQVLDILMRDEPSNRPALTQLVDLKAGRNVPLGSQPFSRFFRLGRVPSQERDWRVVVAGCALVSSLTVVGFWIEPIIKGPNLAILYMLAVVFVALRWGRWAAVFSAVSSALLFDYFFVPPYRSFAATDVWYLITLLGLLSVGLLVSMLTLAAREEAAAAKARELQTAALYSLTKSLASENDLDQMLNVIERHLFETFQRPIAIWMPAEGGLTIRCRSQEFASDEVERKLLTHRQLVREVWGGAHYEDAQHLLRVNISNLRRKLEIDPARPQYIVTEPGVGYRLRAEPHPTARACD